MAISKVILDGTTLIDVTQDTVTSSNMLSGITAHKNDGTSATGNIASKTSSDVTTIDNVVTIPAGHYASQVQKTVGTAQAAQTIHPSSSDQTIASGKYLTGAQTIKGVVCTNLTAGNIKNGVTVKIGDSTDDDCVTSVTGTYSGGGGGITLKRIAGTGTNTVNVSGWGGNDFITASSLNEDPQRVVFAHFTYDGNIYTLSPAKRMVALSSFSLCGAEGKGVAYYAQFATSGSALNYRTLTLMSFFRGNTDIKNSITGWEIYSNQASVDTFEFDIEYEGEPMLNCTADVGLIWADWLESDYNEDQYFQMDGENILYDDGTFQLYLCDSNGDLVTIDSIITENETYQLISA